MTEKKQPFFLKNESARIELITSCCSWIYILLLVLGLNTLKEVKQNKIFKT